MSCLGCHPSVPSHLVRYLLPVPPTGDGWKLGICVIARNVWHKRMRCADRGAAQVLSVQVGVSRSSHTTAMERADMGADHIDGMALIVLIFEHKLRPSDSAFDSPELWTGLTGSRFISGPNQRI